MTEVLIRDAATVLVVRECDDGLETYMVKRNSRMGFLGGRHVFPGGAVDDRDRGPISQTLFDGTDDLVAAELLAMDDAARARGFFVAAIRELYEEAGILLAIDQDGLWVDLVSGDRAARLRDARGPVASRERDFLTLIKNEGLRLAVGRLVNFSHWITPAQEKKRFDTHFFIAPAPPAQVAEHDRGESTDGGWMSASKALDRYRAREVELVPPTIMTLQWLSGFSSIDEATAAARRKKVVTILPKICVHEKEVAILYPGDADYDQGEPGPVAERNINRLILRDGLWTQPL